MKRQRLDTAGWIGVFPFDGFWTLVVFADIAHDFLVEIFGRSNGAASNDIALNPGEPVLDLIEPRRIRWRVMNLDVGMISQERSNLCRLVTADVVADHMKFPTLGLAGNDVAEEGAN